MVGPPHYEFTEPCGLASSGGSGSMGYEVPGALGAQAGKPDKVVRPVAGDGGFQMTMAEYHIPVRGEQVRSVRPAGLGNSQ